MLKPIPLSRISPLAIAAILLAVLTGSALVRDAKADVYATPHCTLSADVETNFITIVPPGGTLDDALIVPLMDVGGARPGDLIQLNRGLEGPGPHARVVERQAAKCQSVYDLARQIETHHEGAHAGHAAHAAEAPTGASANAVKPSDHAQHGAASAPTPAAD